MRKFIGILLFTLVETIGVGLVWDVLFDGKKIVLASIAAFGFFVVEHIIAKNVGQGLPLFNFSLSHFPKQVMLGVTEVIFWDVWRLIHERVEFPKVGPIVALIVFAFLLVAQHNAEFNVNGGLPFFSKPFRGQGLLISVIESFTAFGWILFDDLTNNRVLALIPLFIGLGVEHYVRQFGEPKGLNV